MPVDPSVDLNQPAFVPDVVQENPTAEPSQAESGLEEAPATSGAEPVVVVEEQRVPYSRLRETIEARRDAERRAAEAEENYQRLLRQQEREPERRLTHEGDVPEWWLKTYGDNPNSRAGFEYWKQGQDEIRAEARREAIEAVRYERESETRVLAENERTIDNRLEDLSIGLGRDLTEKEQDAILTIVDEYTPKDADGNYAGDLLSMDKAWEIYNYRQSQVTNRSRQARQVPTALTSTPTQGEPSTKDKNDKDFDPRDWNSYKKRFK